MCARNSKGRIRPQTQRNRELVKYVINDFIDGATFSIIMDKLQHGHYIENVNCEFDNARGIIGEAKKVLKEDYNNFIAQAQETLFNQAMDLFTDAKLVGDRSAALNTLKYITNLLGIEQHNINISGELNNTVTINFGLTSIDDGTES